jgi:FtsP/CotA-like multicopper oxidase with cupredoxin domain
VEESRTRERRVTRRSLLAGAIGVAGAAAAGAPLLALRSRNNSGPARVLASDDAVRRVELARRSRGTGGTVRAALTAEPAEVDLGGRVVRTWAYNGQIPGPVIRCRAGDLLEVDVDNRRQRACLCAGLQNGQVRRMMPRVRAVVTAAVRSVTSSLA